MPEESKAEEVITAIALPVIPEAKQTALVAKGVTTEVLTRIFGMKNLVLSDINDKKAFDFIDGERKFVKKVISLVGDLCEDERADYRRMAQEWVDFQKFIVGEMKPVLEHLEGQAKIYTDEQDRLKEIKRQEALKRTQDRLDALHAIGEKPDFTRAQGLSDEQWEQWYTPLKSAWEKREVEKAALARKMEIGRQRVKLLFEAEVEATPESVMDMAESDFDLFLDESREAFQVREDAKKEAALQKKLLDDRYRDRLMDLANLRVAVTKDDEDAIYHMDVDSWNEYLAAQKEFFEAEQEKDRIAALVKDRRAQLTAAKWELIPCDDDLAAMAIEDFGDLLKHAQEIEEERIETEENNRRLDARFQGRMMQLSKIGFEVNTENAADLREMDEPQYFALLERETNEHNARVADQKKIEDELEERRRQDAPKPAPVSIKAFSAPKPNFPPVEVFEVVAGTATEPEHVGIEDHILIIDDYAETPALAFLRDIRNVCDLEPALEDAKVNAAIRRAVDKIKFILSESEAEVFALLTTTKKEESHAS